MNFFESKDKNSEEESAIEQLLSKIKFVTESKNAQEKIIVGLREMMKDQESMINKQKESVVYLRDKNDELYLKYQEAMIKLLPLE